MAGGPVGQREAIVIGAGPNGLAAGITLARAGYRVTVHEAKPTIGGGCRTAALTRPGFNHDVCAAVHPMGLASPFINSLPRLRYGLDWVLPPIALAHPLDNGTAALLSRSTIETARSLGVDGTAYRRLMEPLVADWDDLGAMVLGPPSLPRAPIKLARFGLSALTSARWLAERYFQDEPARALWAGLAGHAVLPLEAPATSATALVLGIQAHRGGWPFARGGSQRIVDAMASYLGDLGGQVITDSPIMTLDELPAAATIMANVPPRRLLALAGARLPLWYRTQLAHFRHGPGVFKVDFALDGPIPWRAAGCELAGTVHLGGTLAEIAAAERSVWRGHHPAAPFVLLAQPSRFDPTRAPAGHHTIWAYCHVPSGSTVDQTLAIEAQIERFAPGFRQRIIARHSIGPVAMEQYNANYIGGDITAGVPNLRQLMMRPVPGPEPYVTPSPGLYLCSASTPPGPGVHGLCGYHAARAALRRAER